MLISETATTTQLLEALHDYANHDAWVAFDARYRPIITRFARHLGLSGADAADVAQAALMCFLNDYRAGKFDRERGRLRSWLISMARHRAADLARARARRREARGESAYADVPSDEEAERVWDAEERRVLFEQALAETRAGGRFQERTLEAFQRVGLLGERAADVATELGVSVQEIYEAKSRVVTKLRTLMRQYESTFEEI